MSDITTLMMAAAGQGGGGAETDPNFNQTVLLLHGDGTNGAQNNTFLDSSTNNFTITRNGNTTQGTFSPFSADEGKWSNYFDGTNDYLDTDSTLKDLSTGDFCIQFWIYWNSGSIVVDTRDDNNVGWMISLPNSAPFTMRFYHNAATRVEAPIQANVWTHYAITRSSGTLRIFANGVEEDSATYTADLSDGDDFRIGARSNANSVATTLNGYLSNLSVVIGSAIYTSGFTPSTTPLSPSTTNQKLLTCYSNRFVDANTATTAKTITPTGDVAVQPFSPFAPSAAYSASVNGGSGYFDGSGDYLQVTDSTAFDFGTGDLTIEGWFYFNTVNADGVATVFFSTNTLGVLQIATENNVINVGRNSSSNIISASYTSSLLLNTWTHIAVERTSGVFKLFVNGSEIGSASNTDSFDLSSIYLGRQATGSHQFNGYMSNFRIVKGTAITPPAGGPTSLVTAVSGTELLCNFTNAGIFDNTGKNVLETVGNAQIDTTTVKYGTGSMEFDGTGDWLISPSSQNFNIGSGDFTVEFWVYPTANFSATGTGLVSASYDTNFHVLGLASGGSDLIRLYVVNSFITSSGGISLNTWTHIACVRSNGTATIYINGTADGTGTLSGTGAASPLYIGTSSHNTPETLTGYLDDIRITKGVARYTTTFTPPTAAFPDL